MKIAVIGVGAIGGWFGGRLQQAGHDVTFVARGETLEHLRSTGLRLNDEPALEVRATEAVPECDVALYCVKVTGQLPAFDIPGDSPVALTQNSVEVPRLMAEHIGQDRTWPGVVRGFFHRVGPAHVEFHGGPISYEFAGSEEFAAALREAGIEATVNPDARAAVWEKAMFVTSLGALGSLADAPLGVLRTTHRQSLRAFMSEIDACARAEGLEIPGLVEKTMDFADRMPADATSSMQRDLAAGVASELDTQIGAIVRSGRRTGVDTPLHSLALSLLKS